MTAAKDKHFLKWLAVMAALLLLSVLLWRLPVAELLGDFAAWVEQYPVAGAVVYWLVSVVAVVLLVPGWLPMMLAGWLFGFLPGFVLGSVAIATGAAAALLTGRTVARPLVERRFADNKTLRALESALDEQPFLIVALSRLALVIPYNVLNYAYGLTHVGLSRFTSATAVGMAPIVLMYAWLGSVANDAADVLAGDRSLGRGAIGLAVVAVIAIVAVAVVVRRTVRRRLALDDVVTHDETA